MRGFFLFAPADLTDLDCRIFPSSCHLISPGSSRSILVFRPLDGTPWPAIITCIREFLNEGMLVGPSICIPRASAFKCRWGGCWQWGCPPCHAPRSTRSDWMDGWMALSMVCALVSLLCQRPRDALLASRHPLDAANRGGEEEEADRWTKAALSPSDIIT